MGGISVGGGGGSKKSVDSEIPLVPFIDLLLCCVMFLLVTAVWNKLASMEAAAPQAPSTEGVIDQTDELSFYLLVRNEGYEVGSTAGDQLRVPLSAGGEHDRVALGEALERYHEMAPQQHGIRLIADDGVSYATVIGAMDAAIANGFSGVAFSDQR